MAFGATRILVKVASMFLVFLRAGAEIQARQPLHGGSRSPRRRLPAGRRCIRAHIFPPSSVQQGACAGGSAGPAV